MKIDYIEFSSPDLPATQRFFRDAFDWGFKDYGPEYQEITDGGVDGGIAAGPLAPPLVVLWTDDIEAAFEVAERFQLNLHVCSLKFVNR